ncbi:MAG TPA: acyl-CoA dehydrogenase [Aeromicrobium sp.]|nr:acyl-CoA dehydrogenase [Aeromicrobium sp.]
MDFTFAPEADDAAELAASILGDNTTTARLKAVEAAGDRFDRELWATLSTAFDWSELGLIELCRILVEVGRTVAPLPLAVHGPSVLLLTELGVDVPAGVISAAVSEEREALPSAPTTSSDGSTVSGVKTLVRAGMAADAFLVTASTPSGIGVFLVAADAEGVERQAQHTSDGDVTALVTFSNAPATTVGDGTTAQRLGELLTLAAAAEQLGVTEGALRLTADYAKTREQFGRPIGTFQAVGQRLADGFIDVLCQRLALWQAVWRLGEGLEASTEVAVAKLWAADAGHRIAHTTVHVHGGVGIDLDGEAHRYFTSAKRFEFVWGAATQQALNIGRAFAAAS